MARACAGKATVEGDLWLKGAIMFVIDGGGTLRRMKRRPRNSEQLEMWNDYRFIPENRAWDAFERESIAKSLELYDLFGASISDKECETWLKRRAREYCERRPLKLTADPE